VSSAAVTVEQRIVGAIGAGLLIFIGVGKDDTVNDANFLAEKIVNLRIFSDRDGKLNNSVKELGLAILVVSQFTLYADCRKGRRPFFGEAASPAKGEELYEFFCREVEKFGIPVARGIFRSHMRVELCNDGPVTIVLDSGN